MLIFVYYTEAIYIRAEESILDIYYSPCIFFFLFINLQTGINERCNYRMRLKFIKRTY